jgi:hypothetical protein
LHCSALSCTFSYTKALYQPLPCIPAALDTLQARLRRAREPHLRPRLHLLGLLQAGQVTPRRQAAAPLAVPRHPLAPWGRLSRDGGLPALLTDQAPGAPAGPKTRPPGGFAPLHARRAPPTGLASSVDSPPWLQEEGGRAVPSQTLHGLGPDHRPAQLQRPRPRQATKTRPPRRLVFRHAPAAAPPWRREAGSPRRLSPTGGRGRSTLASSSCPPPARRAIRGSACGRTCSPASTCSRQGAGRVSPRFRPLSRALAVATRLPPSPRGRGMPLWERLLVHSNYKEMVLGLRRGNFPEKDG